MTYNASIFIDFLYIKFCLFLAFFLPEEMTEEAYWEGLWIWCYLKGSYMPGCDVETLGTGMNKDLHLKSKCLSELFCYEFED